jgi:hypothetical protein
MDFPKKPFPKEKTSTLWYYYSDTTAPFGHMPTTQSLTALDTVSKKRQEALMRSPSKKKKKAWLPFHRLFFHCPFVRASAEEEEPPPRDARKRDVQKWPVHGVRLPRRHACALPTLS